MIHSGFAVNKSIIHVYLCAVCLLYLMSLWVANNRKKLHDSTYLMGKQFEYYVDQVHDNPDSFFFLVSWENKKSREEAKVMMVTSLCDSYPNSCLLVFLGDGVLSSRVKFTCNAFSICDPFAWYWWIALEAF